MLDCPECGIAVDGVVCHRCGYVEKNAPSATSYRTPPVRTHREPVAASVMAEIRRVGALPKPNPKDWARHILKEAERGVYTYQYGIMCAREALHVPKHQEREPGSDDV